ncbi:hypothetical protein [Candidatus Pelagibacter sp. HIMB1715]|uniref:hypothetical protein n=1 Tax=Candidatus Pelagibacter sp. HIMB1715 TaxID=3413369 RepID=UPI003F84F93A
MKNFCVSMTSVPPRFPYLNKTLDSLQNQNIEPEKIFLNIPIKFNRFDVKEYNFSYLLKKYKNLEINRCNDFGPGTKLLGSIEKIKNYNFVILLDDDHIYRKEMLQIFYNQAIQNIENSYSFCVNDILDCKVGQGADGFLINTKYLKKIKSFFDRYIKDNNKLLLNDDLWISIFLNKIMRIDIISVFKYLKQPLFFKHKSIYKKHTQLAAIIETYSSDRKKARKLKYEENCREYLIIKKKTKNFLEV